MRPTADRVKEAVFSILESRESTTGRAVLDLFAGAGTLGIEALSRGAAEAVFVDLSRPASDAIQDNLARSRASRAVKCSRCPRTAPSSASALGSPLRSRLPRPAHGEGWIGRTLRCARCCRSRRRRRLDRRRARTGRGCGARDRSSHARDQPALWRYPHCALPSRGDAREERWRSVKQALGNDARSLCRILRIRSPTATSTSSSGASRCSIASSWPSRTTSTRTARRSRRTSGSR